MPFGRKYAERYELAWQIHAAKERAASRAGLIMGNRDFLNPKITKPGR